MCEVIVMNEDLHTMAFSIEKEREEYHQRKKKRKLVKLYISLALWAIIIVFLCSPLSTYKMMNVNGNVYLSEKEIIDYAGIRHSWWWIVDADKVKTKLEEHDNIDNVSISFDWKGLHISILEKYPLATLTIDGEKYCILNTSFNPVKESECHKLTDNLIDISDLPEDKRNSFIRKYSSVSSSARDVLYGLDYVSDDVVLLKGKFSEEAYFNIEISIEYLDVKLEEEKFKNIKEEILGKVGSSNVKYDIDNPINVKYNFTNVGYYEIV